MQPKRTQSENPDFRSLVARLDAKLAARDGEDHAFYNQFNGGEALGRVVVLYNGAVPAGCGGLKPFGEDAVEIKRMYTLPAHRGRGVASRGLKELEAWAREDGFSRVVLETGKRQPEAIALYEKHGYLRIPNYPPYEGVDNSVCFEKRFGRLQPEAPEGREAPGGGSSGNPEQ